MSRIPVTILTGFLGAGKTSLLNRLMADPAFRDTAVIVNEFGAVDVDGGLVEGVGDRAFASSTGCLCCTSSGDVRLTLLRLKDDAEQGRGPAFKRVVIETTGLADPAPVIQTFMVQDLMLNAFALNGVVTVVDAATGLDVMARFEEARRQVAVADLLVVTKADLADPAPLLAHLRDVSPNAAILPATDVTPADMFGLAASDAGAGGSPLDWVRFGRQTPLHSGSPAGVAAYAFTADAPIEGRVMQMAIGALQATFGPDLLRLKGIVELTEHPGEPVILHAVQHLQSPQRRLEGWPDGMQGSRLVIIVAGKGRAELPGMMAGFLPEMRAVGQGW